jgi:predicted acetyltransferase
MLFLREANYNDIEKEYDFITNTPADENGFTNPSCGCSHEEFVNRILPNIIDAASGKGLPEGRVPETDYFLWKDNEIVGLFRVRHYLTESLTNGAGHIGYGIRKEYRGNGYATAGLKLAIEKARVLIKENEIYMSVHKNNIASLKAQISNGAVIHHEDDKEFYTRIKL